MRHNFLWNSLLCEPWWGIVIHIFPFNYLPFLTVGMTSAPPLFFLPLMAHILSRSRERTPPGFCGTWRRNWWLVRSEECGRFCQSFFRVSRMKSKNSSLHNESSRKLKEITTQSQTKGYFPSQLSNLWSMPNSVSIGFGTAMKMCSSRRFKRYPTTHRWVSSQLPFTED